MRRSQLHAILAYMEAGEPLNIDLTPPEELEDFDLAPARATRGGMRGEWSGDERPLPSWDEV
jgi:hypothetical protein